jgi:hypothetical protein
VHVCLDAPEEVEESTAVALVVLHPRTAHDPRAEGSDALAAADETVKRRAGGRLRQARNTLLFVAAEAGALADARRTARLLLAWRTIRDDPKLDLKDSQRRDVERQIAQAQTAVDSSVRRAWSQLIVPVADSSAAGRPFALDRVLVRAGPGKSVAQAVWDRARADDLVLEELGRMTLSQRLVANWPDGAAHLAVATLRDWFVQFVAFERLRDESVLEGAIGELLRDADGGFGYAEGVTEEGVYFGLSRNRAVSVRFDGEAVLVRGEVADTQLAAAQGRDAKPANGPLFPQEPADGHGPPPAGPRKLRRFVGEVDLSPDRPIRDLQAIVDSVIGELLRTEGVKLILRLDIEATAPGGFATDDAAVVRDNARSLKFKPEGTRFSED